MQFSNFNAAYLQAQLLYDSSPTPSQFEDLGMIAWGRIGNKHTRLHRYIGNTVDHNLELPCNVADGLIESVHIPINDAQMTSPNTVFRSIDTLFIENYIDAWKRLDSPFNQKGKLVKYYEADNSLQFTRNYKNVMVVYHGIIVDDSGLPLLTDKEVDAIAAYIGYNDLYKKAVQFRDKNMTELAMIAKQDWLKLCNAARIPEHFSQNDMDAILDVKARWDRKSVWKVLQTNIIITCITKQVIVLHHENYLIISILKN